MCLHDEGWAGVRQQHLNGPNTRCEGTINSIS
jgi:hypothetical protein